VQNEVEQAKQTNEAMEAKIKELKDAHSKEMQEQKESSAKQVEATSQAKAKLQTDLNNLQQERNDLQQ